MLGTVVDGGTPQNRVIFTIVHTLGGTYADVAISPNGQIGLIDPRPPMVKDYAFVSLEGITYGDNVTNTLTPNATNWSFSAGFGSGAPGWYKDAFGIVHLVGAAKQINASGSNANLLGTLPLAASPKRTVYTIVHTFNGTYADIAIEPNGQIDLIDPRTPPSKITRSSPWSASRSSSKHRALLITNGKYSLNRILSVSSLRIFPQSAESANASLRSSSLSWNAAPGIRCRV